MARRKAPAIPDELLDQLLAGRDPGSALSEGGVLDDLERAFAERALNAEMDHHLAEEAADGLRPPWRRRSGRPAGAARRLRLRSSGGQQTAEGRDGRHRAAAGRTARTGSRWHPPGSAVRGTARASPAARWLRAALPGSDDPSADGSSSGTGSPRPSPAKRINESRSRTWYSTCASKSVSSVCSTNSRAISTAS